MLNSSNLILITTTLANNIISEKRRNNIFNQFGKYNISLLFNYGLKNDAASNIMFKIIKNSMELFKKTNFDYCIICDDDFYPIDNFLFELNKTFELLPKNWRALHLCPGYLWGRAFRDTEKIGKLNPEYNMDDIPFHNSGRFYINCNSNLYFKNKFWLGGPIAILVNKNNIDSLILDFVKQYEISNANNDVILTQILNDNDFICREPQHGYEKEEGGTTFVQQS